MASLAVGRAGIDLVLVVEAVADGVTFDDLVAHAGNQRGCWY